MSPTAHDISVVINLIAIRKSIRELSAYIAFMVLGFLSTRWFPDAPILAAAAVCMAALTSYYWDHQSEKSLQK
jgi:hypothetical protein